MKQLLTLLALSLSFHSAQAQISTDATNRLFPTKSFGAATGLPMVIGSDESGSEKIKISYPSRNNVESLENKAELSSLYWKGEAGKPLVFVIAGIGGTATGNIPTTLGKMFQSWGYSVITINDPFSWRGALTLIDDGSPGIFSDDSKALYANMQAVYNVAKEQYGITASENILLGYSLGTIYSNEVLKIDDVEQSFHFQQAILMNPPLDIGWAMNKYDALIAVSQETNHFPNGFQAAYGDYLQGMIYGGPVSDSIFEATQEKRIASYIEAFPFSDYESDIIIANEFKSALNEVLLVTSLVNPNRSKVFKAPYSKWRRQPRYDEMKPMNFSDYYNDFIIPKLAAKKIVTGKDEFLAEFSFMQNANKLYSDSRIKMVLSQNDPISRPEDIQATARQLKQRALYYQVGGHCGYYWFPSFQNEFKAFVESK